MEEKVIFLTTANKRIEIIIITKGKIILKIPKATMETLPTPTSIPRLINISHKATMNESNNTALKRGTKKRNSHPITEHLHKNKPCNNSYQKKTVLQMITTKNIQNLFTNQKGTYRNNSLKASTTTTLMA